MIQRELSDVLVVDRSNVTTLLDRVERAGWVRRGNHPQDRRIYCVTLTPSGRRLHARVFPRYLDAVGRAAAGISAEEMRRACATLAALEAGVKHRGPGRQKRQAGAAVATKTFPFIP
jgi:DNA-binding MarR family transcriptional regulator